VSFGFFAALLDKQAVVHVERQELGKRSRDRMAVRDEMACSHMLRHPHPNHVYRALKQQWEIGNDLPYLLKQSPVLGWNVVCDFRFH
jgi:hypothetical protein